jgi:hypothetical protein
MHPLEESDSQNLGLAKTYEIRNTNKDSTAANPTEMNNSDLQNRRNLTEDPVDGTKNPESPAELNFDRIRFASEELEAS